MLTLPKNQPTPSTSPTSSTVSPSTAQLPPIQPIDQVPALSQYNLTTSNWLWPDHIPCGSLTLLEGPTGSGKTRFLADLAARVSSGQPMPDGTAGLHGSVILITPYDPYLRHLNPALALAHADRSHIFPFSMAPDVNHTFWTTSSPSSRASHALETSYHPFRFDDDDLLKLDHLIKHTHCRLLIIDSWSATFDDTFSFSQRTIARLLHDLRDIVAEHNIACILVRSADPRSRTNHLNPADKSPYLPASASTHLAILPDPLAPDHSLLISTKHTFSSATPILQFHLTSHPTHPSIPQFHWDDPSDLSLEDLSIQPTIPTLAPTREHILRILQQQPTPDPITIPALLELLPHLGYQLLRKTLQRMLHDHQLTSPQRGLYALPSSPSPSSVPDALSPSSVPTEVSPPPISDALSLATVFIASSPSPAPDSLSPNHVSDHVSPPPVPTPSSQSFTPDSLSPSSPHRITRNNIL